jgi:hypothetical protein
LLDDLLWHVDDGCNHVELPTEPRAPSWSWCCFEAQVCYPASTPLEDDMSSDHYWAEVVDCDTPRYFGDVALTPMNSRLRLRGPLMHGTLARHTSEISADLSEPTWLKNDWALRTATGNIGLRFYPDVGGLCCSAHAAAAMSNTGGADRIQVRTGPETKPVDTKLFSLLPILSRHPRGSARSGAVVKRVEYGLVLCSHDRVRGLYHRAGLFIAKIDDIESVMEKMGVSEREISIV